MRRFDRNDLTESEKNDWCLTFLKRALIVGGINILLCAFISGRYYWFAIAIIYAVLAISGVVRLYYHHSLAKIRLRWFAFFHFPENTDVEPSERALYLRRIAGWLYIGLALALSLSSLSIL